MNCSNVWMHLGLNILPKAIFHRILSGYSDGKTANEKAVIVSDNQWESEWGTLLITRQQQCTFGDDFQSRGMRNDCGHQQVMVSRLSLGFANIINSGCKRALTLEKYIICHVTLVNRLTLKTFDPPIQELSKRRMRRSPPQRSALPRSPKTSVSQVWAGAG